MNLAGKVWGETALLFNGPNVELHRISVDPGGYCSKHRHATKFNGFFVESGTLTVTTWKKSGTVDVTELQHGDFMIAPPGEYHQFKTSDGCIAFELYWTQLDVSDIERENVGGSERGV